MTPEQMMGMIRAGHDVEYVKDIHGAESRAEFRAWMIKWAEEGSDGAQIALAHFDQAMRDLDSGVMGARGTWHALSGAQRRSLWEAEKRGPRLVREGKEYRAIQGRNQPCVPIHVRTIRSLCARDLLAWDGGAFDPEAAVVLTERGRFVLKHGNTESVRK